MKVKVHTLMFECPACKEPIRATFKHRDLKHEAIKILAEKIE